MNFFTFGFNEVTETSPEVLGGKGAGLVWMCQQELRVPPGFIIPTTVWNEYDKKPKTTLKAIAKELPGYLARLKDYFGYLPLLSVRSGSRVSMPGMMDTILNVGIDAKTNTQNFWREKLGETCFNNSFQRLVTMYGSVVKGLDRKELESGDLVDSMHVYVSGTKENFPTTEEQLMGSIEAVFKSWDNERAKIYRKMNKIPREWGTAVTIQAMVFGNLNDNSATGVVFTRNPNTGEAAITGEFLVNAQGEDVVAGIRTPLPIDPDMMKWNSDLTQELVSSLVKLEKLKTDAQDVEFTIQDGVLYFLQTRTAKRTATATIRIALDMMKEGLITSTDVLNRVTAEHYDTAQMTVIDPKFSKKENFKGESACSGMAIGKPVFTSEDAISCKEPCILIRPETTPDDIGGMDAAQGVITMQGGATAHAAVVCRGMNKPCITGLTKPLEVFKDAEIVSMDGSTGRVWFGKVPIISGQHNGLIKEFGRVVCESMGVSPIIHEVPISHLNEALLYLGDHMLDPKKAANFICAVAEKVDKLYLDMTPSEGAELDFYNIFAVAELPQMVINELESLNPESLKTKLVILGDVKTSYEMLGYAASLRSLVLAEHEAIIDSLDTDPAVVKVMEWKKSQGVGFVSIGKKLAGVKSFFSIEQGLQLLGGV